MDAPLSNSDLNSLLEIVKNFGSVGWAIVAWFAFKAKDALVNLCVAAAAYLRSIADSNTMGSAYLKQIVESNGIISHDIKNMRMGLEAVYKRIEDHEATYHGVQQGGPRLIPRSSTLRRGIDPAIPDTQLPEEGG